MPDPRLEQGYLILADVTGYTLFFTGSELDHAQSIMEALTRQLLKHIRAPFKLVKLEGDAVFYSATASSISEPDRILDQIEACYCAFSELLRNMIEHNTCPCRACQNMHLLDLKFVGHFGEFIRQRVKGTADDLAGPDVILVHRLLKNSVVESTGIKAYALLTASCLERTGRPANAQSHCETCEHIGKIEGAVYDLKAVEEAMRAGRRVYVSREEADVIHERTFEASPEHLWMYCLDPARRMEWQGLTASVKNRMNSAGRLGVDGETHCVHTGFERISRILDCRPFEYFTVSVHHKPSWVIPPGIATFEMIPVDEQHTRLSIRTRVSRRDPITLWITRIVGPRLMAAEMRYDRLEVILAKEVSGIGKVADAAPSD